MRNLVCLTAFFVLIAGNGCGYYASQTRASAGGLHESSTCVGYGCGAGGLDGYYGAGWTAGISPYPSLAASDDRLGAIEVYRARNRWVRSGATAAEAGSAPATETRDERVGRLVPYVRHIANAMCNHDLLEDEDCAPPARMREERSGQ